MPRPLEQAVRYVWAHSGVDLVLRVVGEVDSRTDPSFRAAVELLLLSSDRPVLDLHGAVLDSRAVDVVVLACRRLAEEGRCLLVEAPAPVRRMIASTAPLGVLLVGPSGE